VGRIWPAWIAALLVALALVPAAHAHAVLEESRPASDAVVAASPARVTLRFSESVDAAPGALRVLDGSGRRVDDGALSRPNADSIAVGLEPDLPDGTYTVAWRVVSADTHPVAGAFVFHVGAPGANPEGLAADVLRSERTPRTVSVLFTTARFLSYALLFLTVGGLTALALVLGDATETTRRKLFGLVAAAAACLAVVSLAGIVLQGSTSASAGLATGFRPGTLDDVLGTRFGQVWIARAVLALGALACALVLRRARGRRAEVILDVALVACVGLVLTPAAAGHSNGGAASFVVDVVHVQAGAVWAGGLAFLGAALWLEHGRRWELATRAAPRFSALAVVAVAALLVAGAVNAYLEVRSWSGLWETTYGRLVLAKAALALPIVVLGLYNNRRQVPLLRAGAASPGARRRFLRTIGAELLLVVVVLAVTAVLVAEPPARSAIPPAGRQVATTELGRLEATVVVEPARAGANEIRVSVTTPEGRAANLAEMKVSASLASAGIGPLRFLARKLAPGLFVVEGARLEVAGDWVLRLEGRRGEFTSLTGTVEVAVGARRP